MKLRPKKPLDRWPAQKIEIWDIRKLRPSPTNSRLHTKEDVRAVAKSMERWGVTVPLLVDEKGNVISGHCRLRLIAEHHVVRRSEPVVVTSEDLDAEKQ